jgi:CheY-like chemotaxis protein
MKTKTLIVEDNNDSRAILILMLTKMGYQAIEAEQQRGNCMRTASVRESLVKSRTTSGGQHLDTWQEAAWTGQRR